MTGTTKTRAEIDSEVSSAVSTTAKFAVSWGRFEVVYLQSDDPICV